MSGDISVEMKIMCKYCHKEHKSLLAPDNMTWGRLHYTERAAGKEASRPIEVQVAKKCHVNEWK